MKKRLSRRLAVSSIAWLGVVFLCVANCAGHVFGEVHGFSNASANFIGAQSGIGYDLHQPQSMNQVGLIGRDWNHLACGIRDLLCKGHTLLKLCPANLDSKRTKMLPLLQAGGAPGDEPTSPDPNDRAENASGSGNRTNKDNIAHIIISGIMGFASAMGGFMIGVLVLVRLTGPNENKMSDGGRDRAWDTSYFLILPSNLSCGGPPFAPSQG